MFRLNTYIYMANAKPISKRNNNTNKCTQWNIFWVQIMSTSTKTTTTIRKTMKKRNAKQSVQHICIFGLEYATFLPFSCTFVVFFLMCIPSLLETLALKRRAVWMRHTQNDSFVMEYSKCSCPHFLRFFPMHVFVFFFSAVSFFLFNFVLCVCFFFSLDSICFRVGVS